MQRRINPLLSFMIGCGLALTGLVGKAQTRDAGLGVSAVGASAGGTANDGGLFQTTMTHQPVKTAPMEKVATLSLHSLSGGALLRPETLPVIPLEDAAYPETVQKRQAPQRSRFSMEFPLACKHSHTEWNTEYGMLPVKFNEKKNFGVLVNFAVMQGENYDLTLGGGFYNNSNYGKSKMAKVEYTRYFGATNRFFAGAEAVAVTYENKIRKEYTTGRNDRAIIPHGTGKDRIIPAYRLKAGINLVNNASMRLAVIGGYTYDPTQKMHLATGGLAIGINKGRQPKRSIPRRYPSPYYYGQNKQDMKPVIRINENAATRAAALTYHR